MVVYVEAKSHDDPLLLQNKTFHQIKSKLCTFREGMCSTHDITSLEGKYLDLYTSSSVQFLQAHLELKLFI